MIFKAIVASLILSTLVLARKEFHPEGGRHGGSPPLPPFLQNVTEEGQKAFAAVFKNENLTVAESKAQLGELAKKYGVSDEFNAFEAKIVAYWADVRKNRTKVISNLQGVQQKLSDIFSNKDQTRKAQFEALGKLREANPVEVSVLFHIAGNSPPGFPRRPHGHGNRGDKGSKGRHGKSSEESKNSTSAASEDQ